MRINTCQKASFDACRGNRAIPLSIFVHDFRETLGKSLDVNERTEILGICNDYSELNDESPLEFLIDGSRQQFEGKDLHNKHLETYDWIDKVEHDRTFRKQVSGSEEEEIFDDSNPRMKNMEIEDLLEHLTAKQRKAIESVLLYNYQGLTRAAVARSLKISEDSLRERLKGAITKLRKVLTKAA